MQQHHMHVPRPSHIRNNHHFQQQSAAAQLPPQHIAINVQQNAMHRPQHTAQHMNSVCGPTLATPNANAHYQKQNMQQRPTQNSNYLPGNRLSHFHQQQQQHPMHTQQQLQRGNPQAMRTANSQMQEIRQQHQLVNSSSNNSTSNAASNQQHINNAHTRNVQQHTTVGHTTHAVSVHKQYSPTPQLQQQQEQQQQQEHEQHAYSTSNKTASNNHNNNDKCSSVDTSNSTLSAVIPKTILQNPNRIKSSKANTVVAAVPNDADISVAIAEASTSTSNKNNNAANVDTAPNTLDTAAITAGTVERSLAIVTNENTPENSNSLPPNNKENHAPQTNTNDCEELPSDCVPSTANGPNLGCPSKEKTPMCLVNELARLNKITHQYRLTNEKGPAHCKRFMVTLKLGDEEYSAESYKIKKAQHLAAAEALEKTKYEHPVPKVIRRSEESGSLRATITPTVELNALAMKLGQPTYYVFDPRQEPPEAVVLPPSPRPPLSNIMQGARPHGGPVRPPPRPHDAYMQHNVVAPYQRFSNYRGGYNYLQHCKFVRYPLMTNARGHSTGAGAAGGMPMYPPHPHLAYQTPPTLPCKITLIVGKQKFVGTGRTLQAAKHDAASRALQLLRSQAASQISEDANRSLQDADGKSPISLVHEIGIKRSMTVQFKVLREEGPAHMKNFVTACMAGDIVTEGCGNGKKISKKRAAEKMLEELKKLPPISPAKSPLQRAKTKSSTKAAATAAVAGVERRRQRTGGAASFREKNAADGDAETMADNPISQLIVLLQSLKLAEPVYELISKNSNETTRRREFIMEVRGGGEVGRGRGNNIKAAKRSAAHNLLEIFGKQSHSSASMLATDPIPIQAQTPNKDTDAELKNREHSSPTEASTSSIPAPTLDLPASELPVVSTSTGQVPGILILRQHKRHTGTKHSPRITTASAAPTEATVTANIENSVTTHNAAAITDASSVPTLISSPPRTSTSCISGDSANTTAVVCDTSTAQQNTSAMSSASPCSSSSTLRMKDQLLYLAQLMGFDVDFNDYPKGNHNEYLTIVTLSTTPAQICHGTGFNSEESQNDAAGNALKILSKLGLNNVTSK